MDVATVAGLAIAMGAVFGGFMMEGGHLNSIIQPTAFVIVMGGTIGAMFVQFPMSHMMSAVKGIKQVILPTNHNLPKLVADMVGYAQKARREGVVALEGDAGAAKDPFLKKALGMAVDGTDVRILREALEIDLQVLGEHGEAGGKVMEAGGGYAPTIGILGAVLGLIHVMQNLADPGKLGAGIAVAFVATVYGVFFANIIFLPMGTKLKTRHHEDMMRYELIYNGIIAIVAGENPHIIEQKLMAYCPGHHGAHGKKGEG